MPETYLFEYEQVKTQAVEPFIGELMAAPGLPLGQLRLRDLIYCGSERIDPPIGVYLFKTAEEILYVGKCEKKSFVERIPDQLDGRLGAQYNAFPKLLVSEEKLDMKAKIDATLAAAVDYALMNASLVLVHFEETRSIAPFEKALRMANLPGEGGKTFRPLNGYKTRTLDQAQYRLSVAECAEAVRSR